MTNCLTDVVVLILVVEGHRLSGYLSLAHTGVVQFPRRHSSPTNKDSNNNHAPSCFGIQKRALFLTALHLEQDYLAVTVLSLQLRLDIL